MEKPKPKIARKLFGRPGLVETDYFDFSWQNTNPDAEKRGIRNSNARKLKLVKMSTGKTLAYGPERTGLEKFKKTFESLGVPCKILKAS